jgi:hypothetical protein
MSESRQDIAAAFFSVPPFQTSRDAGTRSSPADHGRNQAEQCEGGRGSRVHGILTEIENDTDRAIDAAVSDLPPGFPERIVSSVIEGVRRRPRLLTHATA